MNIVIEHNNCNGKNFTLYNNFDNSIKNINTTNNNNNNNNNINISNEYINDKTSINFYDNLILNDN